LTSGSIAFVPKPIQSRDILDGLLDHLKAFVDRPSRHLVVVEPDPARRGPPPGRLAGPGTGGGGRGAPAGRLRRPSRGAADAPGRPADCLVLGPGASDVTDDLLASVPQSNGLQTRLPILVYTDGDLTAQDNGEKWRRLADVCTVRRVHSADLLLDQATSLLHR